MQVSNQKLFHRNDVKTMSFQGTISDWVRKEPLDILENKSRLCFNYNKSITNEIEQIKQDPTCLHLNVIIQTQSSSCSFFNATENIE